MKILLFVLICILVLVFLYIIFLKNKQLNENFQYGDTYKQITVTPQPQIYTNLVLYTDNYNTVSNDIANNISNYYPIHKINKIDSNKILNLIETNVNNLRLIQEG